MKILAILACFLLSSFIGIRAQTISNGDDNLISRELLFKRFYSTDGLPDNRIRSIYQDRKGFLWIGTMNGISRYDGYEFRNFYKTTDARGIVGHWVYDICENDSSDIYIGTLGGLSQYDAKHEKFKDFKGRKHNALFNDEITSLFLDKRGKLWIGTKYGLATYDPVEDRFESFKKHPFNTNVSKIIDSYDDKIWIGTSDGVVHYNTATDQYKFYPFEVKPNPFGDRLWALFEDNKNLYIGTGGDGLLKLSFDPDEKSYKAFEHANVFSNTRESLHNTQIFDICKSSAGDFWLGTGRGLVKIEEMGTAAPRIYFYPNNPLNKQSLSDNAVYQVFIDRTDVLWCGTEHGLNKLDLRMLPFEHFTLNDQHAQDQVRSVQTKDGDNIWVGTSKSGLYKFNHTDGSAERYRFNPGSSFQNAHRSLLLNSENDLWLGTLGGVMKVSDGDFSAPEEVLKGLTTFALIRDSKGNAWAGTNNGLFKIGSDGKITRYLPDAENPNSMPSRFIRSIYEDCHGNLWIGFENKGVAILNPDKEIFTTISIENAQGLVFGATIYSILEYPENVVWVGSESGLNKIEVGEDIRGNPHYRIKSYFESDGLPDKSVNGILADNRGSLWISTIQGLARFSIEEELFFNHLPHINFSYSSCYKFEDQKLLFGTSNGFVMFDPEKISVDTLSPRVVISHFKLFNKEVGINDTFNGDVVLKESISDVDHIVLGHKNNVFTIGFSSLHFADPENNRYAYQLEGFDKAWNYTSATNRSATYTNLNPGTYLFKVRASNNFDRWNTSPTFIKIEVLPPPWKTWWAIALYVLLFNVLLFVFIRYIIIQNKQKQLIQFERLEKVQLMNLNRMKLKFFTDISHEFRTPLSLIIGPVEDLRSSPELSDMVKQKIQLVHRNCKNLLYLLDELMTFQKMDQGKLKLKLIKTNIYGFVKEVYDNFQWLAARHDVRYQLVCERDALNMWFDTGKMGIVLNNLIFNAFKFTPAAGTVRIRVGKVMTVHPQGPIDKRDADEWLCIEVEDTGKGILKEDISHVFERFYQGESTAYGTGIGLSLSKSLVELHKGFVTVESEPGIRTCFKVFLPLLQQDNGTVAQTVDGNGAAGRLPEWIVIQDEIALHRGLSEALPVSDKAAERPELLIVDDNVEVVEFLRMMFATAYDINTASNGKEALEKVRMREPDVVISDVMMPEMDGIALCKALKNQISTCHIPVILLTARSTAENMLEGLENGADDYISKPFQPELMRAKVQNLIAAQKRLINRCQSNSVVIPKDVSRNPLDNALLEKVIEAIELNMSNDEFSVENLGNMVGMCRSNLFRKLKSIINQTPIEFIYTIRLKRSMELLLERKLNISEIAYEVGFKNPSSFSKSFKKQFGKSPSEFLSDILEERQVDRS